VGVLQGVTGVLICDHLCWAAKFDRPAGQLELMSETHLLTRELDTEAIQVSLRQHLGSEALLLPGCIIV